MFNYINSTMRAIWKKMARKPYRDAYVSAHISNTVAAQISAMRETRGWTQKDLAEKAGMKQSRVSVLEDPNTENFEARTLRRIAAAFDVGLTIRFLPFSDLIKWADAISDEKMNVRQFNDDFLGAPNTFSNNASMLEVVDIYPAEREASGSHVGPIGWLQPAMSASEGLQRLSVVSRIVN